jgi:hypothetical protein
MTLVAIDKKISYGPNVWVVRCACGRVSTKRTSDFWKLKACSYTCPLHAGSVKRLKGSRKEQAAWHDMKKRCSDPTHPSFHNYGGRGIAVCEEWLKDYNTFYEHIGAAPSKNHSVDRIDNNKGYEPGNVRWTTVKQQNRNRRNTVLITAKGKTLSLSEWATELNASTSKLRWRYDAGWNHEDIISRV